MNSSTQQSFLWCLPLALFVSAMPSCKKDVDPNGTKLIKVITWSSTQPENRYVYNFQYDALDRVSGIIVSRKQIAGNYDPLYQERRKFFYTANEQQPYKSVGFYRHDLKAEKYYFYDNDGRLITDSADAAVANFNGLIKYDWSSDRVITTTITKLSNGRLFTEDSSTLSNNNLTGTYVNSPVGEVYGNSNIYDDKTNPLHTLNIRSVFAADGMYGLFSPGYSKNNITMKITKDIYNAITMKPDTSTYKYEYNTAGLPVACEITEKKATYKIFYSYTK